MAYVGLRATDAGGGIGEFECEVVCEVAVCDCAAGDGRYDGGGADPLGGYDIRGAASSCSGAAASVGLWPTTPPVSPNTTLRHLNSRRRPRSHSTSTAWLSSSTRRSVTSNTPAVTRSLMRDIGGNARSWLRIRSCCCAFFSARIACVGMSACRRIALSVVMVDERLTGLC